jgi:Ca-activated chloride channel family protein
MNAPIAPRGPFARGPRHPIFATLTAAAALALITVACEQKSTTTGKETGGPTTAGTEEPVTPTGEKPKQEGDETTAAEAPAAPPSPQSTGGFLSSGRIASTNGAAAVAAMDGMSSSPYALPPQMTPPENTERYPNATSNPVKVVADEPVSTFSIDVDTASYGVVRRYLGQGTLPPQDAVRVEEMVNYFDYAYATPPTKAQPFATTVQVYPTPWNKDTLLMHVGIKGYDIPKTTRPAANLVFLLDVSGSMDEPDKLPLVKQSIRMLVNELNEKDTVAIVVYAGAAGTVLEPTAGNEKAKILGALDQLEAGGSTAGGEGIRQAYALAEQSFAKDKVNRIILATDGDFNVGITDPEALEGFVSRKRESGIDLTVLGFGGGNYNDVIMQKLAQAGNGNAAFIDTPNEARKVLVDEMSSTLFTIAKDVKIQIEFNPSQVAEYRLIGYETRLLERTDFNNDKVDAGDIGAGHAVTALYEVTPVGSAARLSDPLRYGKPEASAEGKGGEYAFLRIRYKLPGESESKLIERPIGKADTLASFDQAKEDIRFAAAVAAFGQILRGDTHVGKMTLAEVRDIAQKAKGQDPYGYRSEFVNLVRTAESAQALTPLEQPNPVLPN